MSDWLSIDGATGEGGGQIVRSAAALAAALQQPIHVYNIRARRSNPGLQAQHLAAVQGAAALCDAELTGAHLGSREFRFAPQSPPQAGEYRVKVGTAGSITLVAQTLLLALSQAQGASAVEIAAGGTHVAWSPPFHYMRDVFLPAARRLTGLRATAELKQWGWYPQGGGKARLVIQPMSEPQVEALAERGELQRLHGYAATSHLPEHIRRRMRTRLRQRLYERGLDADIELLEAPSPGPGAGVYLQADYAGLSAGFSGCGRRGKPAERVADEPADAFLAYHNAEGAADPHLADQLVAPLVLQGRGCLTTTYITRHLTTQIWLSKQFICNLTARQAGTRFQLDGEEGTQGSVQCLN